MKMILTYSELIEIDSFEDRFNYLKLGGVVGEATFGFNRYMNQMFYHSKEWRDIWHEVVRRDCGFDLAHPDYPIAGRIFVHHMNPITESDVERHSIYLLDPEYLVSTSFNTHNALHFGGAAPSSTFIERKPNDTCPWKQGR